MIVITSSFPPYQNIRIGCDTPLLQLSRGIAMLVVAACGTVGTANLWAADSGTAKIVQGNVRVERDGSSVPLNVGDAILEKDRIVVPTGARAGITLRDDTRISVGPNSTLVINGFTFDAQTQEGNVDTSILRGTMRYVTGLIGRLKPNSVRVATSTATVGIRGTDFIVEVADEK